METNIGASKNQTQDDQHQHQHHLHHLYHNTSAQYSYQPPSHKTIMSFNTIIILAIAIISFTVLFAVLVIVILLHKLKSANDKNLDSKENGNIDSNGSFTGHANIHSSSPELKGGGCLYSNNSAVPKQQPGMRRKSRTIGVQVFTYKELETATEGFDERNVIGNGGYGVVYRGVLSDGTVAAIKRLHMRSNGSKHEERSFRLEVDLLSRLQCPYLVELLGYCADQQHRLLIFEFMANGTLQYHLHHHRTKGISQPLDWGTRLRIALDCARALEFLHEYAVPTVIHRDFKCTNVLLDHNFRAKVSDFGLAKMGSDKINGQISSRILGTTGYLAPEYASTGKLTTKSDVYSYGVVLLELLTGRIPIDSTRPPGQHVLVSWALPRLTNREKVVEMVDPTLHGQFTLKDLIQVAAIAAMCVQPESDYRPLMTDVVHSLIPLVKSYNHSVTSSGSYRFQAASPTS